VVDHRVVVLQRPTRPLGVGRVEADRVLVISDRVVDLDPEAAAGQLHGLARVCMSPLLKAS
jgi:hypothetical protein